MEVFDSSMLNVDLIKQSGKGIDMDRYIYSTQSGEGIGSFFGNLFRTVVPTSSNAIKGASVIAKPHFKNLAQAVGESVVSNIQSKPSKSKSETKKRKGETSQVKNKQLKWQSL